MITRAAVVGEERIRTEVILFVASVARVRVEEYVSAPDLCRHF